MYPGYHNQGLRKPISILSRVLRHANLSCRQVTNSPFLKIHLFIVYSYQILLICLHFQILKLPHSCLR